MSGKYALIIANTEHTDPGLAQLTAPSKDAKDFASVLKNQEVCAFDEVNLILNQPEYIVRGAIDEFFDQKKPNDLLVLYFSGHGVRDELGSLYLAVQNTIRSRLRSTAIKSDYIREAMDQSRSKRQVLILDCCNSGAFAQGTKAAPGVSIGTATAFEAGYGRVILTASDSTQFAWEGDKVIGETDNSLFTHFLVEGLEGEADLDGDGRITVDELYDYAYEKVKFATPKQTPSKFSSKQQGEIVLRQIMRIEDIKPVPLPEDLISEIEDLRPYVREAAVQKLEKIINGKNIGMARSAREALEKIATDENTTRRVAQMASQVLESVRQAEQKAEEERWAKEEAERLARLKAEEERLAREKAAAERSVKEEAERLLAEQKAEEARTAKARMEAERLAEEKRRAEKAEAERKAKEESQRLLTEQKAEEERRAREEAERLSFLKAEEERLAREKAEAERKAKEKAKEEARLAEEKRLAEENAKAERKAKREADKVARWQAENARLAGEKQLADERAKAEQAKQERDRIAVRKAKEERMAKAKFEAEKKQREESARLAVEKVGTGKQAAFESTRRISGTAADIKPVTKIPNAQAESEPPILKEQSLENFISAVRAFAGTSLLIDFVLSVFGFTTFGTPAREIPWYLTALQIVVALGAGFFFGFVKLEESPSTRPFKDTSKDLFWLKLACHTWGFIGFLWWGVLTLFGLFLLMDKFVDSDNISDFQGFIFLVAVILSIGAGIERWVHWKNGARDFLVDSSNN